MDTTRVEIIGKHLDQIVAGLNQTAPAGMSSGQVALIGASIGALSAIMAQLIIFLLTRNKENSAQKKKFLAEERSLAFLLTCHHKEEINHLVSSEYWYQNSTVFKDTVYEKHCYDKHFEEGQKAIDAKNIANAAMAEYFKIITHFTNLAGDNKEISLSLEKIKRYRPRGPLDFSQINDYDELFEAQRIEKLDLEKEYEYFWTCFDVISTEMRKKL